MLRWSNDTEGHNTITDVAIYIFEVLLYDLNLRVDKIWLFYSSLSYLHGNNSSRLQRPSDR